MPATSAAHNRLFAAAVYSTNESNKAGLKQSIILDVYGNIMQLKGNKLTVVFRHS